MFQFMFKGLVRRRGACLLLVLLLSVGSCGMLLLSGLLEVQEAALKRTYEETEIRCVVSNLRGTKTDGLTIPSTYLDLCTKSDRHDFYLWIERMCAKRTLPCFVGDSDEKLSLSGITYPEAAPALLAENGGFIRYLDSYTEVILQSDEPLCIVPYAFWLGMQTEGETAELTLKLEGLPVTLRVAGVYESDLAGAIYCPFAFLSSVPLPASGAAESLSFYVKDASTLDAFKQEALKYFSEPLLTAEEKPMYFAITIQDELFRKTVAQIEDNLFLLRLLLPAMYVISIGVGFLASFLFARGKTREFAVKRSLGMSRARVVGSVFLEQLLVGTFGCLLGIMVGVLIQGLKIGTVWGGILFTICYLSGALTATLWITNVSVMILLKAEE